MRALTCAQVHVGTYASTYSRTLGVTTTGCCEIGVLWERDEVILFARGAGPITFALLTSGKPQLDGRITDFLLDATIQLWVLNPLIQ